MSCGEIKQKMIAICMEIFQSFSTEMDTIEYLDFIEDLGMDSITFITLIIEIEANFEITIPDDILSMANFRNFNVIVRNIESINAGSCGDKKEQGDAV